MADKTEQSHIYVARQAMFDPSMNVRGYELLFRSDPTNVAGVADHDMATAQVILNTFLDLGLDNVVGEHKAFLNLSPSFLSRDLWQNLPPDRVVLEIVGDLQNEKTFEPVLGTIKEAGFEICLDDYRHIREPERYLRFASYAKIDVLAGDTPSFGELVKTAKNHKARPIAKKVENRNMFQDCLAAGCDLFQGNFFSAPLSVVSNDVPQNRVALMRLILLGGIDDKPRELLEVTLIRGKMCELLARAKGRAKNGLILSDGFTLDHWSDSRHSGAKSCQRSSAVR